MKLLHIGCFLCLCFYLCLVLLGLIQLCFNVSQCEKDKNGSLKRTLALQFKLLSHVQGARNILTLEFKISMKKSCCLFVFICSRSRDAESLQCGRFYHQNPKCDSY